MDKTGVKIAIVTQSLANGGAERSCAIMSKMFYETGFETHIITVLDEIEYEYCGTLFNLGLLKSSNPFSRFRRMFALINYLKKHDFDWIIDLKKQCEAANVQFYFVSTGMNFRYKGELKKINPYMQRKIAKDLFPSNLSEDEIVLV